MNTQPQTNPETNKPKNDQHDYVDRLILQKEIEFRKLAREEGEKGRNEALKLLTSIVVIVGILAGIGIFKYVSSSLKRATEDISAEKLMKRAKINLDSIENIRMEMMGILNETKNTMNRWVTPQFQNDWANYGEKYNPAGFTKDIFGRVYLRGLIRSGKQNKAVFNLPEAFRPRYREIFLTKSAEIYTRVDVDANGDVIVIEKYNTWVSLDGISFSSI